MTGPPPWEELARRYLDLWQEHYAELLSDPRWAEDAARLVEAAGTLFPAFMMAPFMGAGMRPGGDGGTASGTAAAGAASGAGGVELARLARRVAELERRLAELEAQKPRPKPRRSPRRPAPQKRG
jgi:hypothetical protein